MENFVLKRLRLFIKFKNSTIKSFGESVGISEGTFKSMFNRGTNPSLDLLIKISKENQDLSLDWLITGRGEMLKSNDEASSEKEFNNKINLYDCAAGASGKVGEPKLIVYNKTEKELALQIEILQNTLNLKDLRINDLENLVKTKDTTIESLQMLIDLIKKK